MTFVCVALRVFSLSVRSLGAGSSLAVTPSLVVFEGVYDRHEIGLARNGAERSRRERKLSKLVSLLRSSGNSQHGDLVVLRRRSGFCHRSGGDFSSRRLAKGAGTRQVDTVRAAFLRGTAGCLRHRTFHVNETYRFARTGVDSVAYVLGLLRRRVLYRGRAKHGDENPSAALGEFARPDVFPFS